MDLYRGRVILFMQMVRGNERFFLLKMYLHTLPMIMDAIFIPILIR